MQKINKEIRPTISVIIASYNAENYIHESINSILNQTLKDIEIIIINDGSTDNSYPILNKITKQDKRIKLLNMPHKGAAAARNQGISLSSGKYISILDADDKFDIDMMEKMQTLAEETSSDIIICPYRYINDDKSTRRGLVIPNSIIDKKSFSPIDIQDSLFQLTSPNAWSKLFKREYIVSNKIHFQNIESCNDVAFTYTALALSNKISILNQSFVAYRNNNESSISSRRGNYPTNIIKAFEKVIDILFVKNNKNFLLSSLSRRALRCFEYELQFMNNPDQLNKFHRECAQFMEKLSNI